uniref:F5/8 type C domain-containing protein n=1 Tax=Branchiostoma floridae TaxID=7739 RepID=C3Z4J1_BRAFL|eukprot:XP_002596568.1 hypothetical protein BRAFLDRAFT_98316 [Branchiostoma floridae]
MATSLLLFLLLGSIYHASLQSVECPPFEFGDEFFRCGSSGDCVLAQDVCDGEDDCAEGLDEEDCWSKACPQWAPPDDFFRCEISGACVHQLYTCDGNHDCPDGSDETDCSGGGCPYPEDFRCESSGTCIHPANQCDGIENCADGSDEENCWTKECPDSDNYFRCERSGACVYQSNTCDGTHDCPDGSDETDCSGGGCPYPEDFRCESSGTCIHPANHCDGIENCADGSDEEDCWTKECPDSDNYFRCERSGACVYQSNTCDGNRDCPDWSDEKNCSVGECPFAEDFMCEKSGACIVEWNRCDGSHNCPDGSDERDCWSVECLEPTNFRCKSSGTCIHPANQCNGVHDCADGSDEEGCWSKECTQWLPFADYFRCESSGACVPEWFTCDGRYDCHDGSDEKDCWSEECPFHDYFRCKSSGACVQQSGLCNGYDDCPDSSDEDCSSEECPDPDFFKCESGETCVHPSEHCNGINDCIDGSDENCWDTECPFKDAVRCESNGACLSPEQFCNGHRDCRDGLALDDEDCEECPYPNDFMCGYGGMCIRPEKHCDGFEDCFDNSDEEDCWGKECLVSESFKCKISAKCILDTKRCDGIVNCHRYDVRDESDESSCVCTSVEFPCANRCVAPSRVCDGVPDCEDASDELLCRCGPKQFPCADGTCLLESQLCDNLTDCSEGEDEEDCGDVTPPGFPLGLASRYIPDVFITASSEYKPEFAASQARHTPPTAPGYCWVPSTVEDQWIQVYFGKTTNVTGVVISGGGSNWDLGSWVTSFTLAFSMDGDVWTPYGGIGKDVQKVFQGNRDRYNKVSRPLQVPVTSRYIRLYPAGYEGWVAMVMEVYVTNDENVWLAQEEHVPLGVGIDPDNPEAAPKIPDLYMTASSREGDFFPWLARLNNGRGQEWGTGWSPAVRDDLELWLQIKHDNVYEVVGVITQGAYNLDRWVTSYTLAFSVNGETWTPYNSSTGDVKIFKGNSDSHRYARNMLDKPVLASYTRFYPRSVQNALRVEVLVKDEIDSQFMSCWDGASFGGGTGVFHEVKACDGVEDCSTGKDEENCEDCAMECPTGLGDPCIRTSWICDEIEDCEDRKDEQGCVQGVPKHCFFTCRNNVTCLPSRQLGDGHQDCPYGEDERSSDVEDAIGRRWGSCSFNCLSVYGNASCVPDAFSCDSDADCLGKEDEQDCEVAAPVEDLEGRKGCLTFLCDPPGDALEPLCVPHHWICDGYPNCVSGEDEQGCGHADGVSTQTSTPSGGQLQTAANGHEVTWKPPGGEEPQEESNTELPSDQEPSIKGQRGK